MVKNQNLQNQTKVVGPVDSVHKTLRLRIIKPYNSSEVEKLITEEKNKQEEACIQKNKGKQISACNYHLKKILYCSLEVEKDFCIFCKSRQLSKAFFAALKKKDPNVLLWNEFGELLRQLQKQNAEAYNRGMSELYYTIFMKNNGKIKNDDKRSLQHYLSKVCYTKAYALFRNSALATALMEKIKGGFRLKELRRMDVSLSTVKSDNFPIPFYRQKDGKNKGLIFQTVEGDMVINLPFAAWERKKEINSYRPWEQFDFTSVRNNTRPVKLLLSTIRRRRKGGWMKDYGTDAEVRKVMNGEYKVSTVEINRGKKIGEEHYWFVNIVIDVPIIKSDLDPNTSCGIDVGVKNPLTCAIYTIGAKNPLLKRMTTSDQQLWTFNKRMNARRRAISRNIDRSGHGKNNRFKPLDKLTEKNDLIRKKIMEKWASDVAWFVLQNRASVAYMENLESLKNRKDNYFNRIFKWPYAQMQSKVEFKLLQYGVKIIYTNPKHTSMTCPNCGMLNEYFTFKYRKKNHFPKFKCNFCGFTEDGDFVGALNLANPNFEVIKNPKIHISPPVSKNENEAVIVQ